MHGWFRKHPRTTVYIAVLVTLELILQVYTIIKLGILLP